MKALLLLLLALPSFAADGGAPSSAEPSAPAPDVEKVRKLEAYIEKERPEFEKRKQLQTDIAEELDRLNAEQNAIRQRTESIALNHGELSMALENLSMEYDKQKAAEALQKQRLVALMKIVNRVRRDGVLRFMQDGSDLGSLSARARVLFRALKSHSLVAKDMEVRSIRLADSERRLEAARNEAKVLWEELAGQEKLLAEVLERKTRLHKQINKQQQYYSAILKDYERASKEMKQLFKKFEAQRDGAGTRTARRGSIEQFPVESGRIARHFGREIHKKFQTVVYHNGIEIEAPHNTPVVSVLPGIVEFEGWVRGMGNMVIIHHGGGFYSVNAHLYTATAKQGTSVKAGDTIGMVGDTGNSDKPSLYFELRADGKPVDPILYFSSKAMKNLTLLRQLTDERLAQNDLLFGRFF
jgi:murein hydrolase activator